MRKMSRLLALLLILTMVSGLIACGDGNNSSEGATTAAPAASETDSVTKTDEDSASAADDKPEYTKLIVGVDDTFAPMGFRDENNELVGFDIDLANAVGEYLGIEIEFQTIEWSMKEMELNQGNIDLIWNGYTITDERKEKVNFTKPYLNNSQVVVVMADSGIETLADLEGKVVAAQTDSSALDAIDSMPEIRDTFAELVTQDTNDMCILELEGGRSDAVVADSVLLNYVISHKDDPSRFKILSESFGTEEYGVGVRKEDTALLAALDEALDALKANGTAADISVKWFGEDIVK